MAPLTPLEKRPVWKLQILAHLFSAILNVICANKKLIIFRVVYKGCVLQFLQISINYFVKYLACKIDYTQNHRHTDRTEYIISHIAGSWLHYHNLLLLLSVQKRVLCTTFFLRWTHVFPFTLSIIHLVFSNKCFHLVFDRLFYLLYYLSVRSHG